MLLGRRVLRGRMGKSQRPPNSKVSLIGLESTAATTTCSAVQNGPDNSIRLRLYVKPSAKQSQVTSYDEKVISIQIAAPPKDGEANEEVIRFMAEMLNVKRRQVELVAGHKSREKTIIVRVEDKEESSIADFILEIKRSLAKE